MGLLCLEYRAVTIPYFLDEMQEYELKPIISKLNLCVKNDWEICRNIMYSVIQSQSTKKIKPSSIMVFPWDNNNGKQHVNKTKELTKEMKDKMIQQMEMNKELLLKNHII